MLTHTVQFKFKKDISSGQRTDFFADLMTLENIPGVSNFRLSRQVSPKNPFEYGLSMVFKNDDAYQAYNRHPDHLLFLQNQWVPFVDHFLEADFIDLQA